MHNLRPSSEAPNPEAENRMLRQQLAHLTAEVKHNDETRARSQQRELSLLAAESLPQLLELLTDGMQKSFRLPCVSLVLQDPDHEIRHLLLNTGVTPEGLHNIFFVDHLESFNPVYASLSRPWLGPLLGDEHNRLFPGCRQVRSLALLPLIREIEGVSIEITGQPEAMSFDTAGYL